MSTIKQVSGSGCVFCDLRLPRIKLEHKYVHKIRGSETPCTKARDKTKDKPK